MTPAFEEAVKIIRALPSTERRKLREILDEAEQPEFNEDEKFKLALKWIDKHREEYDGQWVALNGDELLAFGTDGKKVFSEAQGRTSETPLLHRVSAKETLPFGGW